MLARCTSSLLVTLLLLSVVTPRNGAFQPAPFVRSLSTNAVRHSSLQLSSEDDGIVELGDEPPTKTVAPFLSQGDIAEEVLQVDLNDPKQTRVIIYIILSLVPVLFLIPLMLGSRDLIPLDALPPVSM
jgi:hypothetical protein